LCRMQLLLNKNSNNNARLLKRIFSKKGVVLLWKPGLKQSQSKIIYGSYQYSVQ
jgi:hypothetical protein